MSLLGSGKNGRRVSATMFEPSGNLLFRGSVVGDAPAGKPSLPVCGRAAASHGLRPAEAKTGGGGGLGPSSWGPGGCLGGDDHDPAWSPSPRTRLREDGSPQRDHLAGRDTETFPPPPPGNAPAVGPPRTRAAPPWGSEWGGLQCVGRGLLQVQEAGVGGPGELILQLRFQCFSKKLESL